MPLTKLIPPPLSGFEIDLLAQGEVAETGGRGVLTSTITTVSGTVYGGKVALRKNQIVNGVAFSIGAVGTSVTLLKVGVYFKNGAMLGVSGDLSGVVTANMNASQNLNNHPTAVIVPRDDAYYLVFLQVNAVGMTVEKCTGGQTPAAGPVGTGITPFIHMTGQSDLPANLTIATENQAIWLAATP